MKKQIKNNILIVMLVLSALCWRAALANTWTNQYNVITWTNEQGIAWRYTIDNGEACVGSGQHGYHIARAVPYGTVGEVTIPSELGGCPVTGIGEAAFYQCTNLTSVVIPDTVRKIGDLAFYKSPIKSVKIGSNVQTIGKASFHDCRQLRSVEIPDSVTSLGSGAFALCTSLRYLSIGNGLTNINYTTHSSSTWGTGNFTYCGKSFSSVTIFIQQNPFSSLSSLVAIRFGTAIQAVNWDVFDSTKNLKCAYFPGALPLRSKTMPGVANRVCYITHEAYPDGLPSSTWSGVPLVYYDGIFPSEDERWDLEFYQPSEWPTNFFLSSETNSTVASNRFLSGEPIYCSYSCMDSWGIEDIVDSFTNSLSVSGSDDMSYSWRNDGLAPGYYAYWSSYLFDNLQNLAPGEYTATLVLNEPCAFNETDYSNNTNTVTFTVVPSVEVTFSSEGNTIATRRYGVGDPYGTFTDSPIREGFRFAGWFTDEYGGDAVTASSIVPDLPITLYAHWDVAIQETLTVGGTLASGETKWLCGNLYKVTSDLVVPSGATLTLEPGVVVKFAAGKSLTVKSGGTLNAIGTRALPIVFTSIKDDANGGDTNGDGAATTAAGGDWYGIWVYGRADMAYSTMMYAGPSNERGIIQTSDSGVLTMNGCTIAHALYDGVWNWGGSIFVANSVIFDTGWATAPYKGSKNEYVNCVFYENNVGMCYWSHWNGKPVYRNCVFANCLQGWCETASGTYQDPPSAVTIETSLFYSTPGTGLQSCGRVGQSGNIWGDPLFVNPDRSDFRILSNSPCVDAGTGSYAPEKDYYGSPRMNVDAVRPTGTAAANGAVPDIGIYEVPGDGNIPSADLTVTVVTAPASFKVGDEVEVSWTVQNVGEEPASGVWRDEIEIVAANGQTFPMGASTSQAQIKPGATANFKASVTVPAAPEGVVQVRVTANKYQDLFEAMRSSNNVGITAATLNVPTLAVPTDGGFIETALPGDSDIGFALAGGSALAAQGGVLVIRGAGELDAWLGNGAIAAKDNAIRTAVKIAEDTWLLQVPKGSEPRVTIRNDGESDVAAQLSLEIGDFLLYKAKMIKSGGENMASVWFWGNGFCESMVCSLEANGQRIEATDIIVDNGVFAQATFSSQTKFGLAAFFVGSMGGSCKFNVDKGGSTLCTNIAVPEFNEYAAKWYGEVDVQDVIRSGRAYVGTFRYGNSGDSAMMAPYVTLTAIGDTLIRLRESDAWSKSVAIMATSDSYPASILKPGDSAKETFFYKTTGSKAEIEYAIAHASGTIIPWDDLMSSLRPAWATEELWRFAEGTLARKLKDPKLTLFATTYGGGSYNYGANETPETLSWNKFLNCMRYDCDHLMKIGAPEKCVDRLWQLEIDEALGNDTALACLASATDLSRSGRGLGLSFSRSYSSSLRGRFTNGILGYGWTDNFSTCAELQDAQTLVFHLPSGGSYSFTKVTGTWQPEDARDKTVLMETTTSYILTYASGTVQTFAKSNMKTASIRDNQGNEQTFTYSGSQLQKVQHSDGQSISFTYSGGKLTKATDDQGRTTTYAYTGDLLTSVTAFNGLVTCYEYLSAYGKPTNRALSKITYSDSSTKEFTYDAKGRVASSSVNGGQLKTEIVRGDFGCYSIVAPNGGVTEVTVGANGETLKTVNARGETVKQSYTADSLLEATIAPSGKRSKISYDKNGSPIASMSASGATTAFSYTSEFDNLASVTDAKGHALTYSYDDLGRSTAVNYVDGSSSTLEYNEKGDVVRSTNRRGETIEYEYDGEGNLTKKTWPNGRTFTLAYDAKGNVTSAVDSVTGAVTMKYDDNERLTRIVYPKGRGFTYTYDNFGRMTERTMLGGTPSSATATQRYAYDSLGRLATVTDGDGNSYLTNAYDPITGWLITQTYGNGTVVSNAYDVLGRTVGIYHLKGGKKLAFFEYEYDEDGKCVSQVTAEGVESYTYDADGQLVAVTYPDGTFETFTYDSVGNRITSGGARSVATVTYTVNALNQYTQIDDTTLEYDLDGNMTRKGDTHYYYDTLNRLVAVTNEAENIRWSCEYDVFGNRVAVTDNGTTTERLFVQGSLPSVAAEFNGDTLSKSHILVGAVRIADLTGTTGVSPVASSARYYHSDLLGSARLLTDGTGATKGMCSFKVFGETRVSTGETTDAGYVGALGVETDSNGLLFMRNRYYEAAMGRFVQMDPIGIEGGDINFNRYCINAPIDIIDPDGLTFLEDMEYFLGGIEEGIGVESVLYNIDDGIYSKFDTKLKNKMKRKGGDKWKDFKNSRWRKATKIVGWAGYVMDSVNLFDRYLQIKHRQNNRRRNRLLMEALLQQRLREIEEEYGVCLIYTKRSLDPNEITGPLGTGEKRYVQQGDWMDYTIYFENKTNATAAAQEIFVDLPMDPNLDWSTLELGEIAFGDHIDTSLVGKSHGKASYAMPGTNTFVKTEVTMKDGVLSWYIRDWDPTTADNFPASATGGFLPPNDPETHCGEGHLSCRVRVKSDAPNGAIIRASAQIVFDNNPMIETDPSCWNTVGTFHEVSLEVDGVTTNLTLVAGEPFGELPMPTEKRTGYTFDGWYTGKNGKGTKATPTAIVPTGAFSLYQNWVGVLYKVRFNANGGTGTMADQAFVYGTAQKLSANAFTRKMYAFAGWARSATGAVEFVDEQPVDNLTATADGVVTLYAVWVMDRPLLWTEVTDVVPTAAASTYDGYLYDNAGNPKGTIQVKVGKPNAKTKLAAVKATVVLGAKKLSLKAADKGKAEIADGGPTVVSLVGNGAEACEVTLGAEGLSGTYGAYFIDGARNFFTSKDKAEVNAANAVLGKWLGAVNVVWDGGSVNVSIANKGKAKVKGTLADGKTKVSVNSMFLVGEEWCCVPVVAPKANLAFNLWLSSDGRSVVAEGLGDGVLVGAAGSLPANAKFRVPKDAALWTQLPGSVLAEYLPDGVAVTQSGTRWTLPKAGKVALKNGVLDDSKAGENPSGLKLTYKAKDGSFKGSFKVYAEQSGKLKTTTVNVTGVMVGGKGYGTVTAKGVGSVDVTIE